MTFGELCRGLLDEWAPGLDSGPFRGPCRGTWRLAGSLFYFLNRNNSIISRANDSTVRQNCGSLHDPSKFSIVFLGFAADCPVGVAADRRRALSSVCGCRTENNVEAMCTPLYTSESKLGVRSSLMFVKLKDLTEFAPTSENSAPLSCVG